MFCTKCGAKVPEGNAFCTACGNKVGTVPAKPPVQQPVQQPAPQPVQQPVQQSNPQLKLPKVAIKLPKIEKAPAGEKKPFVNPFAGHKSLLLKLIGIVCAVLLIVSYSASINASIENIPAVSLVFSDSDAMAELKDDLSDMADKMEDDYEDQEEFLKEKLSKSELKSLEKFIEVVKDCANSFSVTNVTNLTDAYEDLADTAIKYLGAGISDPIDELKVVRTGLSIIKAIVLIGAIFCALFVFLGGFFAKPGLAIFGTVLTVAYCLSFCPILMLIVNVAAQVCMIILARQVKKEKKAAKAAAMAEAAAEATA